MTMDGVGVGITATNVAEGLIYRNMAPTSLTPTTMIEQ